jgi:DNA-binding beta-propeller fold protein YncE
LYLALDGRGNVYVGDFNNRRVQKFDASGKFQTMWSIQGRPTGIAVDAEGDVYVADVDGNAVSCFTSSGKSVRSWSTGWAPTGLAVAPDGSFFQGQSDHKLCRFSVEGASLGGPNWPVVWQNPHAPDGVAVDAAGNVFSVDQYTPGVRKHSPTGVVLAQWGRRGAGNGEFQSPYGIATDRHGNVYVADGGNHRIQKFTNDGRFLMSFGNGPDELKGPQGIVVDSSGVVYVTDEGNDRVQKFSPTFLP